jgi:hypothetical protein
VNLVNFGSSEFKDSDFKFIEFGSLWGSLTVNLNLRMYHFQVSGKTYLSLRNMFYF